MIQLEKIIKEESNDTELESGPLYILFEKGMKWIQWLCCICVMILLTN